MALKLIQAPTVEPVTPEQAITHLNEYTRMEYSQRRFVERLISTAREVCEEYQNRAYLSQKWELWLDAWPDNGKMIVIPRPPLQSIDSITCYDRSGAEHTIDPESYFVDPNSEPGRVFLMAPKPAGLRPVGGICIAFTAGHEDVENVPQRIRQAILLLVAEWYLNREATSLTGKGGGEKHSREIPFGVTRLLDFDRVVPT